LIGFGRQHVPACEARQRAVATEAGRNGCRLPRPGSSWPGNHAREAAMVPTTTRRALLAGTAASLASPAPAQQATTLKLYTFGWDTEAGIIALEGPRRTGGRYRIETISGLDRLEAALGKDRMAGGDRALVEGVQKGDLDLAVMSGGPVANSVPEMQIYNVPFLF